MSEFEEDTNTRLKRLEQQVNQLHIDKLIETIGAYHLLPRDEWELAHVDCSLETKEALYISFIRRKPRV